jgi:PAS domain S-box-containing protein
MPLPADGPPAPGVSILLVDDRPANLLALEAILEGPGRRLVRASAGEQALALLGADDFAVVLLDLRLPGLDGFQTARLIRSSERPRHTPVIFLTAGDGEGFPLVEAYKLGAVDYLVKPLVPEILRAKVAVFVELYEKSRQLRLQAEQLLRAEQERAQRELRASEGRFAGFMAHLPGLAWIKDAQGRYAFANDAALRAFGASREALYGRTDEEVFPPETARQFRDNDRRALEAGQVRTVETLAQAGEPHHSLVSKFAIPDPAGGPPSVGGVAIDVTDRMKAEQALREAARRKDEFLALLGHELRNPLAPIRSAVEVLKKACAGLPVAEWGLAVIDRQSAQMARLVDDLLDVSRLSHGKIALRKQPAELAAVVDSAVETCRPLIEARRHSLAVELPPEPVWLEADPARLTQVLVNLLTNACKYTQPGGQVGLGAEAGGGGLVLRVRDSGVGIPADMLARVFELFVQLDRSAGRANQWGLGVGLALVKAIAELHGGSVEATSGGPGEGSEFVVRLPGVLRAAPTPPAQAEAAAGAARPLRVLVVEDSTDAAESLAVVLRAGGHEVRVAADGPAALEAAACYRPDAVLLDVGLPGMDGHEVARRLRRHEATAGALLVALTGYGAESDRRDALAAGCDHHLAKPADPGELRRLLESAARKP